MCQVDWTNRRMVDPSQTVRARFDVRTAGGTFLRTRRRTLYLIVAADAMLIAFGAWFGIRLFVALRAQGVNSADVEGLAIALGLVVVLLAVMVPGIRHFLSGATQVTVDGSGVTASYRGGRTATFRWHGSSGRLVLYDYSAHPRMVTDDRAYAMTISGGPLSVVTKECFEEILANAQKQDARIASYKGSSAWYGFSPEIYRIRGGVSPSSHSSSPPS